mmetsp:Transcript_6235/g.9855  ORF Transcript_6235/g.9855 Transcript_6235/m.9855 type:complete len:238 (-) Transcript_6235:1230-1943(-)
MVESEPKRARVEGGEGDAIPYKNVELWSYWRSSCSWRVRLALELKGIPYKYHAVHLVKDGGEQLKDDYAQGRNPMKQVPTIEIDGFRLTQSVAIVEYIEETCKTGAALLPDDAKGRAVVRKLVEIINSGTQPVQNLAVLLQVVALGGDKMKWGKDAITNGFVALEDELSKVEERKDGDYCYGSSVTFADIFLVPQVYNANRFSVDMDKFPLISKIHEKLVCLEPFKKAAPDAQPDAQ